MDGEVGEGIARGGEVKAKNSPLDPEKRAAIIAALLAGESFQQIIKRYQVAKSTVSRLKKSLTEGEFQPLGTEKTERLIDLVEAHLIASLKAGTNIANQTNNQHWRDKQSADSLAILYGVLADKSLRVLEAAQAVRQRQLPEEIS
jgi:transposase